MLLECRVIGKIRVPFAAGGAPVAVGRRAANASSSLKNILYIFSEMLKNPNQHCQNSSPRHL
jgi:hypothetical protein